MFRMAKFMIFAALLIGGVAVPFMSSKSESMKETVGSWWNSSPTSEDPATNTLLASSPNGSIYQPPPGLKGKGPAGPIDLNVEGPPVFDLGEVFRFDVAMDWLIIRWPRVSTQLAETNLQGYRVPLVSGVREDDIAGSLTYYFDDQQIVRKITFEGTTGDATRLVQLVTNRFNLRQHSDRDPGLFSYRNRWNNEVISELRVRPADVVRADAPHRRFRVSLRLQNPANS